MSDPASAFVAELHNRTYPNRGIHGRLVEVIGQRIIGNALAPGTPLPREVELMGEFQASRTAVREAIKVLAAKGLVDSRQRRGMQVRPQDDWNLLDPDVLAWYAASSPSAGLFAQMVELRRMIEPSAARLAADRRTEAQLVALELAFASMRSGLDDLVAYYQADLAFHRAIFRASGNPFVDRLGAIVAVVLEVSFRLQQRSLIPAETGLALHAPVLEAIKGRKPDAAEVSMLAIIDAAAVELETATRRGEH